MKDKEMIEEMSDVVHNLYDKLNQDAISTNDIIEALYNAGYRKLPKDSVVLSKAEKEKLLKEMYEQGRFDALANIDKECKVVLSREEYEELKFAKKLLELREETIKYLEDANIRYSEALENKDKEMTEKILNDVYQAVAVTHVGRVMTWGSFCDIAEKYSFEIPQETFTVKQFGVEIKES